jgi:hypothetical protein
MRVHVIEKAVNAKLERKMAPREKATGEQRKVSVFESKTVADDRC